MRRFLLKAFLTLIVVLAVAGGAAWFLLQDEGFLRARLQAASLKYTGRQLTLDGPLALDLGRLTTLEAGSVTFANAPWTGNQDMISIGRIRITIDLASLFSEQLVFPALDLEDCRVRLVKDLDGRTNWNLAQRKKTPEKTLPKLRTELPVRLNDLTVQNCEVTLKTPRLEVPLDIRTTLLSMQHHDDNRWEGTGSGSVNDYVLSFSGLLKPFSALFLGGPLSHELNIELGEMSFHSSGSVQDAKTWTGADISAQLKGPEITNLLNEFSLPLFSEGAFDFQLKLNTEGQMTQVDIDGDLGSLDVTANGELDRLIRPRQGNIQLSIDGPKLGALADLIGIKGIVNEPFSHRARATFQDDGMHINQAVLKTDRDQLEIGGHFNSAPGFAGTELDIQFHTDEIGRWTTVFGQEQQDIGPLDMNGKLSADPAGLFSLQASATQGKSQLKVNGDLGHLPRPLALELDMSFSSPDASQLAAMAGVKNFPVAPLSMDGRIGLESGKLSMGKVRIELAGDQADINGTVNLHDRHAGSNATARFDVENLDTLGQLFGRQGLPAQPLKLSGLVRPDGQGLAFQITDGNLGKIQLELSGRIPDLQKPLVMDGNFDVNLPRLSDISFLLPGMTLPDAPFLAKGKIEKIGDRVQVDHVDIQLAGSRAQVDGIVGLQNHFAGSDLNFQIEIDNAGELGRMFGQEGIPDQPVKLDGQVTPEGNGMTFRVNDGNIGDLQLELSGEIADLNQPTGINAQFDVNLPRLSDISFLFPGRKIPAVPFTANGSLHNEQDHTRLDQVQLTVGKIQARVDGALLHDESFDLTVNAEGVDVSGPAKLFGQTLKPEPFSLSTGLTGKLSEFDLNDLKIRLGDSRATGDLTIKRGETNTIHGSIESSYLDISQWMTEEEAEKEAKPAKSRKWLFDERPVMEVVDIPYDLDLDVTISVLQLRSSQIQDLTLGLRLTHNFFELDPFTMKGERGGLFNGELRLDSRGAVPRFHLSVHGDDMRLGLTAVPGQDPSTYPPIELDVLLNSSGNTYREMARALDGKLRAFYGSGEVASGGLRLLFSDFITELFSTLNPFAKTSKYTHLDCAVAAADAVSGKVDVFPVIYNTEQLTILSKGTIDLNTEKINLSFNTKPRQGLGLSAGVLINPLIKVGGTLASPAIEMDPAGTVASTSLAVATAGISLLAKSVSDRFLSSSHPCEDAREEIAKKDNTTD